MHVLVTVLNAQRQGQRLPVLASETSLLTAQHTSNEAGDTRSISKLSHRNVYFAAAHAGCGITGTTLVIDMRK